MQDIGIGFCSHAGKCVVAPRGNFALHQNAVPVAVVKNPLILGPMNARKDAIQIFQVLMIVSDPFAGLRHSKFRIAPRHALDTHQPHALAIQEKTAALNLEFPDAKSSCQSMSLLSASYRRNKPIEIRTIEMPQLRLGQNSFKSRCVGCTALNGKTRII